MNRRQFVAAAAVGSLGASAGCLGSLIESATTVSASPAIVAESAAGEAGYEYKGTTKKVITKTVAGEDVEATNYISEYTRTIETPLGMLGGSVEAGVFAVITTPKVSVAGKDFNPVGEMSNDEIVELIQNQYENLKVGNSVGGRAVDKALGKIISIESYEGKATFQGQQGVDVFLDIAQPDHGDDHLVLAAVYPDDKNLQLKSERERVDTMVGGLKHGENVNANIVNKNSSGNNSS